MEKAPQVIAALDIGTSMMRLVVVRHDLLGPALLAAEETPRPPGVAAAQRALRALVRRVELRAGLPLREVTLGVRSSGLLPTRRLPPVAPSRAAIASPAPVVRSRARPRGAAAGMVGERPRRAHGTGARATRDERRRRHARARRRRHIDDGDVVYCSQ